MDLLLPYLDQYLMDSVYTQTTGWARDDWRRQLIGIYLILVVSGWILYLSTAGLSWLFLFDKRIRKHPKFLPHQELKEITVSVLSAPVMGVFTAPIMLAQLYGYSKLYGDIEGPQDWKFLSFSIITFFLFTDMGIYWVHRWLHTFPFLYKYVHKLHHKWIVTTPFASHAFHPVDGFAQSLPYHIYVFLFPFHKAAYLLMFVFVNVWTISIHDQFGALGGILGEIINGADHHTIHHSDFLYNYGQYLTLWDRIGKTHRMNAKSDEKPDIKSE